jgi:hypothetical protein
MYFNVNNAKSYAMKKNLLITVLSMFFALGVQAQHHMFQRKHEHEKKISQLKAKLVKPSFVASNARAAQLIKFSSWDVQTNSWTGQTQNKNTYTNGLLTTELTLNYAGTDTLQRIVYSYNGNNQVTEIVYEYYTPGVGFFPSQRRLFSRSGTVLKTTIETDELYDMGSGTWLSQFRSTITIDDRGYERLNKFESYNAGMWIVSFGYTSYITYFGNTAKQVLTIDSIFNPSTMQFEADYRVEKVYASNGDVEKIYSDQYIDGQWTPQNLDSLTYTIGQVTPTALYSLEYDTATSQYAPLGKFYNLEWDFFDTNRDIYEIEPDKYTVAFYAGGGLYDDVLRFSVNRPDANGSYIQVLEEFDGFAWDSSSRYSEIFDANKNWLKESNENYSAGVWSYDDGTMWQNTYDANNDLVELILMPFDFVTGTFENENKIEFSNYTNVISGVTNQQKSLDATLYPNPSNDGIVFVNLDAIIAGTVNYSIFSTNGQEIAASTFEAHAGKNKFSLPTLDAGFYIVHLQSAEGVSQFKVFVK